MIAALRALIRKDLLLFAADPRALLMSFAAPIAIASFFGYAMGGAGSESEASRIPVLVVDQDGSAISRAIVANLNAEKSLDPKPANLESAREAVRKGAATVAVVIPANFGENAGHAFFSASARPEIALLYDPSHSAERQVVEGILTGDVMQAVSKETFNGESGKRAAADALKAVEQSKNLPADEKKSLTDLLGSVERLNLSNSGTSGLSRGLTIPFSARAEAVTARRGVAYNGYGHAFAGMGVQFILFLGIDVGIGLLLQRQRGLWKRFRAAPLSRGVLLGSRAASAAILAFFVLMVNFGFARLVFGVRVSGSMAGFLGVAAAFALMTAAFGLLIASLGKTPEATRGLTILVTLVMVMLGGAWIPMFLVPAWLQKFTLVMPTRWAIDGLEAMTWRGLGFSSAIAPIAVQLGFAAVFGVLAVARFRWEAEG